MKGKRSKHNASFKANVALAAIREQETVAEIARCYQVHANQVYQWKRQLMEKLPTIFERAEPQGGGEVSDREAELLKKVGELTMARDFLEGGLGRYR